MHAVANMFDEAELGRKSRAYAGSMNMAGKQHMHAAAMSRGDKRRLEMAMCLAQEPRLLLLDEPTAGMARADTNNTIDLLKEIKRQARHHHGDH